MAVFNKTLKTNKVYSALANMIISLQTFDTGISDLTGIYEPRKVDGTLYGDTKLYISTDVLQTHPWDGTDTPGSYNLLTKKLAPEPAQDALTIDVFRQVWFTQDSYLSKQAFMDEGGFSRFNGVQLSWLNTTKEVYEHTKYTADIIISGTEKAKSLGTVDLEAPAGITGYDLKRWRAQELYRQIEDYMAELNEPSREYNDLGFLRNYKLEDFDIIVPLGVLSSVRKHDVPFLYTPDDKPKFKEVHWKYFGEINDSGGTTGTSNNDVRALIEKEYGGVNYFPGDLLPNSTAYEADETYTATFTARPSIDDAVSVLFVHKDDYPIMSAFAVGTSFFNARRLDMNHYLTFGHNNVYDAHLREKALLKLTTEV